MKSKFSFGSQKGQTLIELMITIGLAAIILPALLTGFFATRGGRAQGETRLVATNLVREAQEAVRVVREKDWTTFAAYSGASLYHPVQSGNSWSLALLPETINGTFNRQILINDVYRDVNGNVVTSGGVLDPSTKKVVITVSWGAPIGASVTSTEYFSRWYTNTTFVDATSTQFTQGTVPTSIAIDATIGDGAVKLGPGATYGDWCAPNLSLTSVSLPQASSTNAIYAVPGKAFVGIGDISSQGQGQNFVAINITQPTPPAPPSASIQGGPQLNIDNVYGDFGDTQYAYLALDRTSNQMQIVDTVTNNQLTLKGTFNAPTSSRGNSVYVVGTGGTPGARGYLTVSNKLYTIDLSSVNGARPQVTGSSTVTLAGTGVKVIVVGSYAYVINSGSSNQFQIINLTNYTVVGQRTLNNQPARDLAVNAAGDRAYVVTKLASGQNTFYIINTTTKTNPTIITSTGTNGMDPHGVNLVTSNKAIVVGFGGTNQYQVYNIANDAISSCGNLPIPPNGNGIYGIASVAQQNGDVFSYITTGDSKFRVIRGGPGGSTAYASTGTFESRTFNAGHSVAFNYFSATTLIPALTSISFKIAIKPASGGVCPSFTDADFVSVTQGPIAIPGIGFTNPGQCLRYRAILAGDGSNTPILYDVTFNYSP